MTQKWLWYCSGCTQFTVLWQGLQQVPHERLVIVAKFEASGPPIQKLDAVLYLDDGTENINIFGNDITMGQQAMYLSH
jgi:hypothetical protein